MKKILLTFILLLASWGTVYAVDSDIDKALVIEMQSVASTFVKSLGKTLKTTMQTEGPKAAIRVCESVAPALANQLSRETGWKISRVSLKVRNPLIGTPDAWEREQLIKFSNSLRTDSAQLDVIEVTFNGDNSERRLVRYMRALPTGPLCLTCHGKLDDIPDEVASVLEELYPHDKAIGYARGEIRGAISIQGKSRLSPYKAIEQN